MFLGKMPIVECEMIMYHIVESSRDNGRARNCIEPNILIYAMNDPSHNEIFLKICCT